MGIPIGLALDYGGVPPQALLLANGITHWVPENEGKWQNEWNGPPDTGHFNFTRMDTMVSTWSGLTPRYHNGVWHKALPTGLVITPANWQSEIANRMSALIAHWPSMAPFVSMDVVNEAFDGYADGAATDYYRNSVWFQAAGGLNGGGKNWWYYPFQQIQNLVPPVASGGCRLIINDFECGENDKPDQQRKFDTMFAAVQGALNVGVRVDGVGWQCHLDPGRPVNLPQLAQRCQKWMTIVGSLEVTELNVTVPNGFNYNQAANYAIQIVKVITENANVPTITGWTAPGAALLGIFENNALTPLGQGLNWSTPVWT